MLLILCHCPSRDIARLISQQLLEQKLVACATIQPAVSSQYRWMDQIETAEETPLVLKARREDYALVEQLIKSLHPYQVPEIIAIPVTHALKSYQDWLYEVTARD